MDDFTIIDATTDEHFRAMSLIHALGWRDTYKDAVPADYMAREITDDRWVEVFRQNCLTQNGIADWGEIASFYTSPAERGKGYGGILFEEALKRLKADGFQNAFVFVLRENEKARRFYAAHGFAWDGTSTEIPFPPKVCVDLRYVKAL